MLFESLDEDRHYKDIIMYYYIN